MSRPNKPLPVPALEGDLRQSGHQVVDEDESGSGSEEVVFLAPERKASLSPGRSAALNASTDSIGSVRRNTAVSRERRVSSLFFLLLLFLARRRCVRLSDLSRCRPACRPWAARCSARRATAPW